MEKITVVLKPSLGLNFEAMRPALQLGAAVAIGRGGAVIASLAEGDAPAGLLQLVAEYQHGANSLAFVIEQAGEAFRTIEELAQAGQAGSPVRAAETLGKIEELAGIWRTAMQPGELRHDSEHSEIVAQQGKSSTRSIFDVITGTASLAGERPAAQLPDEAEHLAQIERVAASLREHGPDPVALKPCSFCGGSPAPIVTLADFPFGAAPRLDNYGDDGLSIEAYVFCHECGATGPIHEDAIYTADDYDSALEAGVDHWQTRDERHARLYEASQAEGLNLFPRTPPADGEGEAMTPGGEG